MRKFTKSALVLALAATALSANAQDDLLAGKPIYTLGEAKTWTSTNDATYTFVTSDLEKLVATPTNTANVYLFPEAGGGWNTDANKEIGIQGFYIDLGSSEGVGTVSTTWEGAAASAYSIYLTDEEPTPAILNTTPTYSASGLGQFTANTAVLPEGSKGRYLVFQGTDATNWGWGVKIRSIKATAPADAVLTTFTAAPGIVALGEATDMTLTFKDQNGLDIAADEVEVGVSDNATYADGKLTVNSGDKATITATMGEETLTADVWVAAAPALPVASDIKTAVFTNTVTDYNATAGWVVAYNGGAVNAGTITFPDGEVAQEFLNTRCVFFHNTATTGAWNGNIKPIENGYRTLHMDVFGTKDCDGVIDFEGGFSVPFTLEAGKWNSVNANIADRETLNNMSIRFTEANMCDVLLANIYFTAAYVEGDETAPVLEEVTATAAETTITLTLKATDDLSADVYYTITIGDMTYTTSGKSGEAVEYTVTGLDSSTEYTVSVTAGDGKNVSEAKVVTVKTTGMPDAPTPTVAASKVVAVFSAAYDATAVPAFDAWGSAASMTTATTENGETVLLFNNYNGQWGGLVNLTVDLSGMKDPKYLHLDIFSGEAGSVSVAPVWGDATGDTPNQAVATAAGEWKQYDLALTDFGYPAHGNSVIQLALTNSTLAQFALNNVYFYTTASTGIEDVAADGPAVVNVYGVHGVLVRSNVAASEATAGLAPGIYIVAGGNKVEKVLVR